jgi:hypothetical protein
MPNAVKYSTTNQSGSIRSNNIAIGNNNIEYGPTAVTGWYNGVTPPDNKYVIYEITASGNPKIYVPNDDVQFIRLARNKGSISNTVAGSIQFFASQSGFSIANKNYPNIVTSGSQLLLDASYVESYPTTQSLWYDISGYNYSGSLTNGPTFNSNGYIVFDGVNDYISFTSASSLIQGQTNFTIGLTFQSDTNLVLRALFGTLRYGCGGNIGLVSSFNNLVFYNDYGPNWPAAGTCYAVGFSNYVTSSIWIYAVATYDGVTTKVYAIKQGALSLATGTTKTGSSNVFDYNLEMGRGGFGQYLTGKVTNAFIYNKTLSEQEILQNYYQAPIVTNGLVFAVDAGNLVSYESGSTTTYSLTGSASGSLINGVGYLPNNGGTWAFDGTDDRISISPDSNLNFLGTLPYSIEVWGNLEATGSGARMMVSRENSIGVGRDGYNILLTNMNSSTVTFSAERFASNVQLGINTSLATSSVLNRWAHYVVTYDGQFYRLFFNGTIVATSSLITSSITNTISTVSIANRGTGLGNFINMKIAIANIYNTSLSPSQVLQNFNAQKNRFI